MPFWTMNMTTNERRHGRSSERKAHKRFALLSHSKISSIGIFSTSLGAIYWKRLGAQMAVGKSTASN